MKLSFSSQTKEELCQLVMKKTCCGQAALCGWIYAAGSLQLHAQQEKKLSVLTDNRAVGRWGISLVKECYYVQSEIRMMQQTKLNKRKSLEIIFQGAALEAMLINIQILSQGQVEMSVSTRLKRFVLQSDCCKIAYMRGMFLGCGSLSNPKALYHLEFVLQNQETADLLCDLLNEYVLNAKIILRKKMYVVYLKESEKIVEFLKRIGAIQAVLDFENIRALKEFRNDLNRKVNCETANIQKTITASARQIENIEYLISNQNLQKLNPIMQETARLRVAHPDATLQELGDMLSIPIGKSGVNHRLNKIDKIAEALKKQEGR